MSGLKCKSIGIAYIIRDKIVSEPEGTETAASRSRALPHLVDAMQPIGDSCLPSRTAAGSLSGPSTQAHGGCSRGTVH